MNIKQMKIIGKLNSFSLYMYIIVIVFLNLLEPMWRSHVHVILLAQLFLENIMNAFQMKSPSNLLYLTWTHSAIAMKLFRHQTTGEVVAAIITIRLNYA